MATKQIAPKALLEQQVRELGKHSFAIDSDAENLCESASSGTCRQRFVQDGVCLICDKETLPTVIHSQTHISHSSVFVKNFYQTRRSIRIKLLARCLLDLYPANNARGSIMLLDSYQEKGLLFNSNLKDKTSTDGIFVYRGELVLKEGAIADAMGRRKPPLVLIKEAVILVDADKIKFITGFIDELEYLNLFSQKYLSDTAEGMLAVFFVANIAKPIQVQLEGLNYVLLPLTDGMVWNEIIEELKMEKSDFKGQTPADKIITLYHAVKEYRPKYATVLLEETLGNTIDAKRAAHGAV